jgi:hypothetical protein
VHMHMLFAAQVHVVCFINLTCTNGLSYNPTLNGFRGMSLSSARVRCPAHTAEAKRAAQRRQYGTAMSRTGWPELLCLLDLPWWACRMYNGRAVHGKSFRVRVCRLSDMTRANPETAILLGRKRTLKSPEQIHLYAVAGSIWACMNRRVGRVWDDQRGREED